MVRMNLKTDFWLYLGPCDVICLWGVSRISGDPLRLKKVKIYENVNIWININSFLRENEMILGDP